jgi:L-threonylcarbamoyladenylate synthase
MNAERLTTSRRDLAKASELIIQGKFGAISFKSIYGLFGDSDTMEVAQKIMDAKERPEDRKLILTSRPQYLQEHVDFSKTPYTLDQIIHLQTKLHALGVILPASNSAPYHLTTEGTVLNIWTEYNPIITIIEEMRKRGGRALVGTSANKHGNPTIISTEDIWTTFGREVDFIVEGDHFSYPEHQRKSTTVIDLTTPTPMLKRKGSVSKEEIEKRLQEVGIKTPIQP